MSWRWLLRLRILFVVLALLASCPFLVGRAQALCSTSLGAMNFGVVDLMANTPVYATVTATVTCTGFSGVQSILVCIGEGWTTQGGTLSNARYLNAGGTYDLTEVTYQDAGHTTVWGAPWDVGTSSVYKQLILTTNSSGAVTTTFTGYGSIGGGHTDAPPGLYEADSVDVRTLSHVRTGSGDVCSAMSPSDTTGRVRTFTGTLSATVNAACSISAAALNFGSTGSVISANRDATATITAKCTNTTPYSIGLGNGTNASGGQNRMRLGATTNYVNYELYTDSARVNAWSTTTAAGSCSGGANTCVLGTGTGTNQTITVYGRVPPQTAPRAGTFTDTVVMTITY